MPSRLLRVSSASWLKLETLCIYLCRSLADTREKIYVYPAMVAEVRMSFTPSADTCDELVMAILPLW